MSGLHRRAIQQGKTVSRKARSKPESGLSSAAHSPNGTPGNSRAGSRANSRAPSRYASDDESAGYFEDDDLVSLGDSSMSGEDEPGNTWADRLQDRVTELQDRKRSSVQGREATLRAYNHLLRHHFAKRQISQSVAEIIPVFLRAIRHGHSDEERLRALQAYTLTVITCPSESMFEKALPVLKAACYDAEREDIKVAAIRALSVAATSGEELSDATDEILDLLLDIVSSDGHSVGAEDSGAVVTAALQAWAFIASHLSDLGEQSELAIEAFMEQLDSSDPDVQTSAGSNLALLFEAAREHEEETGEESNMQHNQYRIITRMSEIIRDSSKSVSKKERKHLRANFTSMVTSLERGTGPGYSTAGRAGPNPHLGGSMREDNEEVQEFGYREKIRIHDMLLLIDTWALHARAELLKILLGSGLGTHYLENPVIQELLSSASVQSISGAGRRK